MALRKKSPVVYVYGDGGLWKLNADQCAQVLEGANWLDVGTELAARQRFKRSAGWDNLPEALYADDAGRLGSARPHAIVTRYYEEEIHDACRECLRKAAL